MIAANELRIGNWVQIGNDHQIVYQIIFNRGSGHSINHKDYNEDFFNPVPLTPEILKKCELQECQNFANDWTYIKEDEGEHYLVCDFVKVSSRPIKYLHQLQNLYFSLTGRELEINL